MFLGMYVNGGDRRRKVAFLLLALAAVMAVTSAALAVVIALDPGDVAEIGGTFPVDVECPANPCEVSKVTWSISGPPFQVTAVNVKWTPRNSGDYTVFVVLYGSTDTSIVGSGSATVSVTGGSSTITTVNVSSDAGSVRPRDIYKVEIVIVQS